MDFEPSGKNDLVHALEEHPEKRKYDLPAMSVVCLQFSNVACCDGFCHSVRGENVPDWVAMEEAGQSRPSIRLPYLGQCRCYTLWGSFKL